MIVRILIAAALLAGALAPAHTVAQKLYRCGTSYQDRPCDAGQAGQAIGRATAAAPEAAPSNEAECRQRGADAQKMAWAREAGQTLEQQLDKIDGTRSSAARKQYERALVTQVYERRGSSAAVRAGIEADCVAEKQKAAETAAAAKALGLQPPRAQPAIPSAAPAGPGAEERRVAEENARQSAAAREAQRRQERCQSLNAQVDNVRNRQRAGGSAATMESLNRQRRELDGKLSAAGC